MAALIDTSISANNLVLQSTITSSAMTIGGTNRGLIVFVASGAGSPVVPTSVKCGGSGGTALTQVGTYITFATFFGFSAWTLINPPTGSQTIYADFGSSQDEKFLIAVSVKDANQTTLTNTVAQATGSNSTPTANATSVSGDLVVGCSYYGASGGVSAMSLTLGAGQTITQEILGSVSGFEGMGGSYETASSTSTTHSYTIANGPPEGWGIFAMAVNAAGAASATSLLYKQKSYSIAPLMGF